MSWAIDQIRSVAKWSSLTSLGKSRLIQSSFIWLIIVPAIAKILEPLQPLGEDWTFDVLGRPLALHLGLPFSWKLFYVSAVLLTIASLVYQCFCPPVIKDLDGNPSRLSLLTHDAPERYAKRMGKTLGGDFIHQKADFLWDFAEGHKPMARKSCALMYAVGLGIIVFVMLQNLVYVLPAIFA